MSPVPPMWEGAFLLGSGLGTVAGAFYARRPLVSTAHGSAGWTRPARDLRHPRHRLLPPGSVFLGVQGCHTLCVPLSLACQHGVIIGGSGTGKSRGYFLPNAAFANNTSLVICDPKNEAWELVASYHTNSCRFAPLEPEDSLPFNWIPLCQDARVAELCARAFVESGNTRYTEQIWLDLEAAFLAACFAHASTLLEPTPVAAYHLFTRQDEAALLKELRQSSSPVAQEQAHILQHTQDRMKGSILPAVAARLQFLRDTQVARFTSGSREAPDFTRLRKTPTALFWCLREHDIDRLRPLTAVFFTLLLESLTRQSIQSEPQGVPLLMLLDEFPAMGALPGFDTIQALARGRQIAFWLGVQSLSQLSDRYGKEKAHTILANCQTKISLHGLDYESARYISDALGETTIVTRRKSRHKPPGWLRRPSLTHSVTENRRALMTPDEVRRLSDGEAIVLMGNRRPMRLPKYFFKPDLPPRDSSGEQTQSSLKQLPASLPAERAPSALPPQLPGDLAETLLLDE